MRKLVVILGDFLQGVTRMLAETVFANLAAETFKAPYNAQYVGFEVTYNANQSVEVRA